MKRQMTLMHKDVPVMDVMFQDEYIVNTGRVYDKSHLPIVTCNSNGIPFFGEFVEWWGRRSIPKTRINVRDLFQSVPMEYANVDSLSNLNLGLSLSDQYWMRPKGSGITYDDVNFFDHSFGSQLADVCLGADRVCIPSDIRLIGASSSLGGDQKKAWKVIDGERYLLKESRLPYYQESVNETIGTKVCQLFDIPCVHYTELLQDNHQYSVCKPVVTKDEDMVSGYDILSKYGTPYSLEPLKDYHVFLLKSGVDDYVDDMVVIDYILRNTDRHWLNLGLIRDANTGDFLREIPVFDFGNSLWFDVPTEHIDNMPVQNKLTGRMFEDDFRRLKPKKINYRSLCQVSIIVQKCLNDSGVISRDRALVIAEHVQQRAMRVAKYFDLMDNLEVDNGYDRTESERENDGSQR